LSRAARGSGAADAASWWREAVVYQVYVRSFQDSDGDGIGDLRGITRRLEYLSWLGVDAAWLSPIYPSPLADMGYDVADHTAVAPEYGTLADLDELIAAAHERGIRVLLDLVPSHTSIEHPWFREHPEWYVWSPVDGPPNNWLATFGGSAWSRERRSGRWYLHSFYPEQPDLDWRNPEVRAAVGEVIRFWAQRGIDGFRIDAVDRLVKDADLRDDPPATEPFALALPEEYAALAHVHSTDGPEMGIALGALREAAGDAVLVGEVYLPTARLDRYLDHLDLAFAFELLHAPWEAGALARVIAEAAELGRVAWVLSNHDSPRIATRLGEGWVRAAAMLLLTLPGAAFIYQGDELGMPDGPGGEPPIDRAGRDAHRHPMPWSSAPNAGFSTRQPWLPVIAERRHVSAQRRDPGSLLSLYRAAIALRPALGPGVELLPAEEGVLAYRRGEFAVALNLCERPCDSGLAGEVVLSTREGVDPGRLEAGDGAAIRLARA
jgi:alpha-glucosidase